MGALLIHLLLAGTLTATAPAPSLGEQWAALLRGRVPHETAWTLYGGRAYDWNRLDVGLVSVSQLYGHEAIWLHRAPEGLGLRLEASLGGASGSDFAGTRLLGSAGFQAVYAWPGVRCGGGQPFVEGGVALLYTDFQRPGQGLRVNFNPVAGLGWRRGRNAVVLRLFHVSNGELHRDNRGINAAVLGLRRVVGP